MPERARKLLLISPALVRRGGKRLNVAGFATMEPLGLGYVAALTPPHWEVRIWDELHQEEPAGFQPDLVGITSLTPTVPRAYELSAHWRSRGVPVVIGGIHATLCPEEVARHADSVFTGEAEGLWPQVIADFEAGRLAPRYDGGAPELAGIPVPRRDLYGSRYRIALISASRGCRNRCEFCAVWKSSGGRFRTRPVAKVLAELRQMPRRWVTFFTDDNVYTDRDYSLALFRAMRDAGLRQRYAVQASLDIADDDELLMEMKQGGCFAVMVGLESISERTLGVMRKGVNLKIGVQHYREKVEQIHARGLMVAATFIFGNDGEEADIFERTANFVLDAGIDLAHFGLLVPTPGTEVFARLQREGRLLLTDYPSDYALLDLNRATFRPQSMTPQEAERGLAAATTHISSLPVTAARAWRTWRTTGSASAALISFLWTRTGLHERVFG